MFVAHATKDQTAYLDLMDWDSKKETMFSSVFMLVEYDEKEEPLSFVRCEDWWMGFSCSLTRTKMSNDEFSDYIRCFSGREESEELLKYIESMTRDGYLYHIKAFMQAVQLPEELVFHGLLSESECLDWFLNKHGLISKDKGGKQ